MTVGRIRAPKASVLGTTQKADQLTYISAFSGLGGLDLGLESAGFKNVGCIEADHSARLALGLNRADWPILKPHEIGEFADQIEPENLGFSSRGLHLLAGASPCQPFSKAAQWERRKPGISDPRATTVHAFFRIVEKFLPRAVMMENVHGFASGTQSALPTIVQRLEEINRRAGTAYSVFSRTLNALDFGAPQRRERVFLVATRNGHDFEWPEPTHSKMRIRAWDAIGDLATHESPELTGKWAQLLPSIPEGWNYLWHTDRGGGLSLFGYRCKFWSFLLKLAKNQPSWTLPANPGPSTGPFHWSNRPLTIREMLRLQTFPASWRLPDVSRVTKVRLVGNATPPLLAEILGRAIGAQLFDRCYDSPLRYRISRKRVVPRRSRTRGVPEEFLHLVGEHSPHPGTGLGPRPVS